MSVILAIALLSGAPPIAPAATVYQSIAVKQGAAIRGRISYNGRPPLPRTLAIAKNPDVCGSSRVQDAWTISADGGVPGLDLVVVVTSSAYGRGYGQERAERILLGILASVHPA